MEITFLDLNAVLQLHAEQIRLFGGDAALRDEGLLQSAIAQPQAAFGGQFLHEFPHGMAAAYLFHIAANHPFVDGNKRTAFASSLAFLKLNGFKLGAPHDESYQMVLSVAKGEMQKSAVAEFIQTHSRADSSHR